MPNASLGESTEIRPLDDTRHGTIASSLVVKSRLQPISAAFSHWFSDWQISCRAHAVVVRPLQAAFRLMYTEPMERINRRSESYTGGPHHLAGWRPEMGNPLLLAELRQHIETKGKITFAEFMDLALYHPRQGYYVSGLEKVGGCGDYYTSPEVHPAFGTLLAVQLQEMWQRLGYPDPFTAVEVGAGTGTLAFDLLSALDELEPRFRRSFRYHIVEISPDLSSRQRERLRAWSEMVTWQQPPLQVNRCGASLAGFTGCLIANEVLDAFPVHVVTTLKGELREVYVTFSGDRLVEVIDDLSTEDLASYFHRLGQKPPEGFRAEVNLRALTWLSQVAGVLAQGFVLLIDYGYMAGEVFSLGRPRGSLLCYHRHAMHDDPYVLVGYQDLTAHLDFTSLIVRAREEGLALAGLTTQREFLTNLGLYRYVDDLATLGLSVMEYQSNRLAMEDLLLPTGLGGFKVLVLEKGVVDRDLSGLNPNRCATLTLPPLRRILQRPRLAWGDGPEGSYITGRWEDLLK